MCHPWFWVPSPLSSPNPIIQKLILALPGTLGFGVLLALPGAWASGTGTEDGAGSSTVTITLLLLLLLLLVTGLALAWRRLSRVSGGYYHPVRLGAALWAHTRRLLWASPAGRWLRPRSEMGSPEEPEQQEDEQDAEEDFMMDGGPHPQEEEKQCEGAQAEQAPDVQQDTDSEGGLGLSSHGPVGSGSSAEALLSDLHAFSGSAAWDDSAGRAGGQGLHVTAL